MNPLLESILIDGAFVIDNSTFEVFTTCPRAAFYHILKKRKGAGHKAALNFGGAVHAGLEVRYKSEEGAMLVLPTTYSKQCESLMEYVEKNPIGDDEFRTPTFAATVLQQYNQNYTSEPFSILRDGEGKPMVELAFAVPIGEVNGIPCIWSGKVDVAISWEGRYWVLDHKTTSILGGTYFNQFYNSNQMIGYCWSLQHLLNQPIAGALINVLAIRRPTKTGKSIEFVRQRFEYPTSRIEEWQDNTLQIIENFFHMCDKMEQLGEDITMNRAEIAFPQHTQWCIGKFGQCGYFDVCTVPSPQREMMLQSGLYADITWSPLKEG